MQRILVVTFNLFCILNLDYCDSVGLKSQQSPQNFATAGISQKPAGLSSSYTHTNATFDAQNLYFAVTGLGTNETVIINILAYRTNSERQFIKTTYTEMFNKDLIDDLKADSSGNFRRVVKSLLLEPHFFLAKSLNKALTSLLTDEKTVNEILCTKTKDELLPILNAYEKLYNKTLKAEIDENVDGDRRTFLKAIISDQLRERGIVNTAEAKNEINIIPNTNDFCSIHQNPTLMQFFAKKSFEQINYVSGLHQKEKYISVQERLQKYCSDESLRDAYDTVVRYANDKYKYYAEELYKAMIGLGTDDVKLIRIIVSRSEIDLSNIKKAYKQLYNTTLESSVDSETSGYYEKILLKLLERAEITGVEHV